MIKKFTVTIIGFFLISMPLAQACSPFDAINFTHQFQRLDKNYDYVLTEDETAGLQFSFGDIDIDGDGQITHSEWIAHWCP